MPAAVERSTQFYKCDGTPRIELVPIAAISTYGGNIRRGDILTLGQVAGAPNSNRCLQAVATAANVHASTLILGMALADCMYLGTTLAADSFMMPVLIPDDKTLFRLTLEGGATPWDAAGTLATSINGSQHALTRATIATTAATARDGSKGFYSVAHTVTDPKVEIVGVDRGSWPLYPTGTADVAPYVFVRVIPAQRVVL